MKKLLSLLTITALGTTSIPNANIILNSKLNTQQLKNVTAENEIPDDMGANTIEENISFYTIHIDFKILNLWSKINNINNRYAAILKDIENPSIFTVYDANISLTQVTQHINDNISKIMNIKHIQIYGVRIFFGKTIPNQYWWQFSSTAHNASLLQEIWHSFINDLNIFISQKQWQRIYATNKNKDKIYEILNEFPQEPSLDFGEIWEKDIKTMVQMIIKHFDKLKENFDSSKNNGWVIKGETNGSVSSIVPE